VRIGSIIVAAGDLIPAANRDDGGRSGRPTSARTMRTESECNRNRSIHQKRQCEMPSSSRAPWKRVHDIMNRRAAERARAHSVHSDDPQRDVAEKNRQVDERIVLRRDSLGGSNSVRHRDDPYRRPDGAPLRPSLVLERTKTRRTARTRQPWPIGSTSRIWPTGLRQKIAGEQYRGAAPDRQVIPEHTRASHELDQRATQHRDATHRNAHHGPRYRSPWRVPHGRRTPGM